MLCDGRSICFVFSWCSVWLSQCPSFFASGSFCHVCSFRSSSGHQAIAGLPLVWKERLERWCMHQVDTDRKVSNVVCKANWQDFKSQGASQTYSLVEACWLTQSQKLENPVQPFSPSAPFGLKECRFGRAALVLQSQTSSIRLRNSYQLFIGAVYGSQGTDPHPCNETGTLGQEELSTIYFTINTEAELMHDKPSMHPCCSGKLYSTSRTVSRTCANPRTFSNKPAWDWWQAGVFHTKAAAMTLYIDDKRQLDVHPGCFGCIST